MKNGDISNAKLANPNAYFEMDLRVEAVGNGQADVKFDQIVVPKDCDLIEAKAICMGVTAQASMDIHEKVGGTILSGDIDLDAAGADTAIDVTASLSTTSFSEDDILELYCTTDGGGDITSLRVHLLFKLPTSS